MLELKSEIPHDLKEVIESKYGMANFLENLEEKNKKSVEIKRISKEIFSLTEESTNPEFIKKLMSSDILSKEELSLLVHEKYREKKIILNDKKIDLNLIISAIVGIVSASLIVAFLFSVVTFYFPLFYFPFLLIPVLIVVYFVCYLIIKFITKKSRNNIVVFLAALIATISSVFLGFYLSNLFSFVRL